MRCPICDTIGKWKNVDEFRYKPSGMSLCEACGFITYPEIISKQEKLKEFYREDYRETPSIMNIYSGQRKLHYHAEFLSETFDGWKAKGKNSPVITEVGAAFGMFLDWTRKCFPKAQISGTELTLSFRRVAFHEFGIRLDEEFDTSKKYDLIASYKVAEHIPEIDKEIRKYALALAADGQLYISVPTWFNTLNNFGASGYSLEYYYHTNHINVWTRGLFETLLAKCGLKVVKVNRSYYDDTYLCVRDDEQMKLAPRYEDPAAMLKILDRVKKASLAYDEAQYTVALESYPDFPEAWNAFYEMNRAKLHKEGFPAIQEKVIGKMLEQCTQSAQAELMAADICMRYEQWDSALKHLQRCVDLRPNEPGALQMLGHVYRQMAARADTPELGLQLTAQARDAMKHLKATSLQCYGDAVSWAFQDAAKLPMPHEDPEVAQPVPIRAAKA